jgi:hypothetical protein
LEIDGQSFLLAGMQRSAAAKLNLLPSPENFFESLNLSFEKRGTGRFVYAGSGIMPELAQLSGGSL